MLRVASPRLHNEQPERAADRNCSHSESMQERYTVVYPSDPSQETGKRQGQGTRGEPAAMEAEDLTGSSSTTGHGRAAQVRASRAVQVNLRSMGSSVRSPEASENPHVRGWV